MHAWVAHELRGCRFPDKRIGDRLEKLVGQLSGRMGQSIPMACQDWASTKAAYRFFASGRVNEALILRGHFEATRERVATTSGPVLVMHDTTEFSYRREAQEAIGRTHRVPTGSAGRSRMHTVCGILMHASLVVTPEGLPLGLAANRFWTRNKFKGTNRLTRHVNATRIPIERKESVRWLQNLEQSSELLGEPSRLVHIGDRESDIYELFCAAQDAGCHFLVRTCVDRLAEDGAITIATVMHEARVRGLHRVEVLDRKGQTSEAVLELRHRRIRVLPPIGKQRRYPPLDLTVLHARERGTPRGRDPIDWKLVTDLRVRTHREAVEKLTWYSLRWRIETYFKILKSGCRAEALRLRTAERLACVIAVFCILAWRVFWMTMVSREDPEARADLVFTDLERLLLDRLVSKPTAPAKRGRLSLYIVKLAKLGGYLARTRDGPPGNTVIWRGLTRLTDIELGVSLGHQVVGN